MDIEYIKRRADQEIERFLRQKVLHKKILLVEGARQVGKTSFVEHAVKFFDKKTVSVNLEENKRLRSLIDECDDFNSFEMLLLDRLDFNGADDMILFIDEAQESCKLGQFVRFMKEKWSRANVILSGSTLTRLFREKTRYPVGRVKRLTLWPFSFSEYLIATGKKHLAEYIIDGDLDIPVERHKYLLSLFDNFILIGGLPDVVISNYHGEDAHEMIADIFADYETDFIRIFGERDIALVDACFRSVANFVGSVSKNTTVAASPGTSMNTKINEIFKRLEDWHLILKSNQRGPGPEASHNYLPKRYLFDTGLLRNIRESATPSINIIKTLSSPARIPLGGIMENQTAIEIARSGYELAGWKKAPAGTEIDFILKKHDRTIPIECKAALDINKRHHKGILSYLELYGIDTGYIVSLAPYSEARREKFRIINIPIYLLERFLTE